ncbi:unnamed protein product [Urochloa humidicola]
MATAEQPPRRGGARRVTLSEGQLFRITGMSLADPAAAAAGQPPVTVLAEVGHEEELTIGTLSSEEPIKPVLPPVELGDGGGEFVLRHDAAASSVRLYGYYLDPPEQDGGEEEPTRRRFFVDIDAEELGGEEEVEGMEHEDETLAVEDLEVGYEYESDCGEDELDDSNGDEEEEEEDETSESSDVEEEEEDEDETSEPRSRLKTTVIVAGDISKRRKISTEDSL